MAAEQNETLQLCTLQEEALCNFLLLQWLALWSMYLDSTGVGHFQFMDPAGCYRRPLFAPAMRGISVCLLERASCTRPASSPIAPSALNGLGRSGGGDGHSSKIWAPAAKMLNK